jgi:nucleotide-binding universal stress UspA family protein
MTETSTTTVSELVVPLDGRDASVRAVPVAGRIAARLGLGVRLFAAADGDATDLEEWMQSVAETHLAGKKVTIEVAAGGEPVSAIVKAAGESGMVCMATAASLLPHQGHIGSVAEGVTREIGRPVILVGPEMEVSPGANTTRLVVPVDGSPLSEAILPVAADLAVALQVPAWVVTVVSPSIESSSHMGVDAMTIGVGYLRRLAGQIRDSRGHDYSRALRFEPPLRRQRCHRGRRRLETSCDCVAPGRRRLTIVRLNRSRPGRPTTAL